MEYSTLEGRIIIPEYGRNVQRMVEYALTIEDRERRQRCVEAIMQTMCNLFPYLRDESQQHKMYDHLAIMSDFQLDIDSPYERPEREQLRYRPERIPYAPSPVKLRHYGRLIEQMITAAVNEPNQQKREELIVRIANRMKRNYTTWNKDQVEDQTIINDIARLSDNHLNCDFENFSLNKIKPANEQKGKKQKNKK